MLVAQRAVLGFQPYAIRLQVLISVSRPQFGCLEKPRAAWRSLGDPRFAYEEYSVRSASTIYAYLYLRAAHNRLIRSRFRVPKRTHIPLRQAVPPVVRKRNFSYIPYTIWQWLLSRTTIRKAQFQSQNRWISSQPQGLLSPATQPILTVAHLRHAQFWR